MSEELLEGLILEARSGFFEVDTEAGRLTAQLRGRLKEERQASDLAAVGDRVSLRRISAGEGVIEEVLERERVLSRQAPLQEREQVLIANPDQAVFVFACSDPPPNLRLLDRMLVAAERDEIPVRICVNKVDLAPAEVCQSPFETYEDLDYPVDYTSAKLSDGIEPLRRALKGKISVFAGPSGVGKTSLLNAIEPELGLRVGQIRRQTRKGKHTTVAPKLVPLEGGGYVADTPGVKAFALWDIEPEELDAYFREIRPLVADCAFSDCTHLHEPGCAVIRAVEQGRVSPERYDSYQRMRQGEA